MQRQISVLQMPPSPATAVSTAAPAFRADVLAGLTARPRALPARCFYARRGSELFEQITTLEEYYPARTETLILQRCAAQLAALADAFQY